MTAPVSPAPITWPTSWKTQRAQSAPTWLDKEITWTRGLKTAVQTTTQALLKRVVNVLTLLLLLIGAGTVWDATIGDGPLPQMNDIKHESPALVKMAQQNSTAQFPQAIDQHTYWPALTNSRSLLLSLSPQISLWLLTLHQQGHIETQEPSDIHQTYNVSADTPLLAAYRYSQDTLYLGKAFWRLSDGQKVAVLAHEYRHARQNPGKRIGYQLAQWIGLGQLQSESRMESEAIAYEQQATLALGLN